MTKATQAVFIAGGPKVTTQMEGKLRNLLCYLAQLADTDKVTFICGDAEGVESKVSEIATGLELAVHVYQNNFNRRWLRRRAKKDKLQQAAGSYNVIVIKIGIPKDWDLLLAHAKFFKMPVFGVRFNRGYPGFSIDEIEIQKEQEEVSA